FIRLRDAGDQKVLARAAPPRNDTAQPFSWDLSEHASKQGYLEIVDGDSGNAYAWLAVGRFNPPVVLLPTVTPSQVDNRQLAAAELAGSLRLGKLAPKLASLFNDHDTNPDTRAVAAKT